MFCNSVCLLLLVALEAVYAFSTPPRSTNRNISPNGPSLSRTYDGQSSGTTSYTNNYITAIEDQGCTPNGFFVASTDHNYALVSPSLLEYGWLGLSINGNEVFIIRKAHNSTLSTKIDGLSVNERDFMAEIRANFTQNLAGLKFAHYTSGSSLSVSNKLALVEPSTKRSARLWTDPTSQAQTSAYHLAPQHQAPVASLPGYSASLEEKIGQCSARVASDTNYYNLLGSALNDSLAGDVYFFDFHCNALDVYSSSVSLRRRVDESILYRDHRFFSFARSNMPLSINRFFLLDDWVIFVYNDGTVLVKQSWMLETKELDTVVQARQQLRHIAGWQQRAAQLVGRLDPYSSPNNGPSNRMATGATAAAGPARKS